MIIDIFELWREIDSVTISIICNLSRQSLPRLAKHQEAISYLFLLVPSEICLTILSATLATVHLILQVSTLSQKFFSVTRDISHSSFARQRLSYKELPQRDLIFCLLFLYFIYRGTADVYILNYHSSYYNVKLVSWEDYIIYSTPLVLTYPVWISQRLFLFFFIFFFFFNKKQLKSPASALGLVNPKSLIKGNNVILSALLICRRSISLSL